MQQSSGNAGWRRANPQRPVTSLTASRDRAAQAFAYAKKSVALPIEIDPVAVERLPG